MSNTESLAPRPDYLKAYSLTCEPFADTLDGRFFYGGSALMQRLDLLTHLTQFGESIILVSGPHGSGKTTLLGRFVGQTGKHWRRCVIDADEFGQFRQRLADALGIGEDGDEQQMLTRWAANSDASQLLVIVIDDSQQLPADALQKLCGLLDQRLADRVRLIIFGTPEAQSAAKQALERNTLPCTAQLLELPKLSEEDTAAYLMYRLAVAGYSGESPFTPTEVRAICKAADGRPAGINRLAHDALLEQQIRSRGKRPRPHKGPRPLLGAAWSLAALLVVGVTIYLGWQRLAPTPSPDLTAESGRTSALKEVPLNLPEPEPEPVPVAPPVTQIAEHAQPDPALPARAPEETAQGVAIATRQAAEPADALAVQSPALEKPNAPKDREPARAQPVAPKAPPTAEAVVAAPQPKTVTSAAARPEDTPAAAAPPATAAAVPAVEPQASIRTPAKSPETNREGPHGEAWLLQQPPDNYSLQLLGTRKRQSIIDYIQQNKLRPEQSAYYRGNYKGGEWYVLVYGVFPSRQAALDARASLPAQVRKEKPWPRSLASVHTAINEVQ